MQTNPSSTPDLKAVKARQQQTWASGDFAVVGTTLQLVGEQLAEAADILAGERVLDVAAGNGNATLAAARRFARVVSTDYVPQLLEKGKARAQADGLDVAFEVADAEALPFENGSFDVVLSTFGAMFAPDQERTAAEMRRVCRKGGRIGLASWTPDGFIGDLFRTVARFVPPPAGVASPMAWGTEHHLATLFDVRLGEMRNTRRLFQFRYLSADHFIDLFRQYYGPTHKAFGALDADGQQALHDALHALLERWNRMPGKSLVVPAAYLETVLTVH
jgi:ubiquinone/menaquinone biosynthesis C-methylase UbiE